MPGPDDNGHVFIYAYNRDLSYRISGKGGLNQFTKPVQTSCTVLEIIGSSRACTGSQWDHYNSFHLWFSVLIRVLSVLTEVSGREEHADNNYYSPVLR